MTLVLDHASIVVEDFDAAIAFFTELGMKLEGQAPIEGAWVDRINAVDGIKVTIAMMAAPDGGKLEITKFHAPALVDLQPKIAPPNALGLRSIMFAVDNVDDMVARLRKHGGELVGTIENYETFYRLCYLRGPAGVIVALAQTLGG